MKKKLVAMMLVAVMGMSTLTGCAQVMYNVMKDKENTESTETYEYDYDEPETEEDVVFDDTEEVTEEVTEDVAEDTEASAEDTTETAETTEASEPAATDFDVVEATLANPAKPGEWVATKTYCGETDDYRTIYYRITGVMRGADAQAIVDEYNSGDHFIRFDELEQDDVEYCVVTYETHFPTDFPASEYGIYSADVDFSACNLEDSGAIANYIGLSSVYDTSEDPEDFFPGDTFTEGKAIFAMVKGHTDYLLKCYYYENDEEYVSYVKPE